MNENKIYYLLGGMADHSPALYGVFTSRKLAEMAFQQHFLGAGMTKEVNESERNSPDFGWGTFAEIEESATYHDGYAGHLDEFREPYATDEWIKINDETGTNPGLKELHVGSKK
ncbi:MAG: hypothetical protein NUV84_03060 [Candidatus Uhrbacteria bacterium]|nr:hypothetical protein [Candidatus Uhrbacteria bacterium]